jgi:DNA-binding MarR family transcriptional regulator
MEKQLDSEKARELKILETLEQEPELRQVDLAARLGIAVGTVNWLLKRLAAKGYVKVKRIGRWHWRYLLTPRGFAEKARLTQRYLHDSMHLYRQTRKQASKLVQEIKKKGYSQVYIDGDNDLVDVCRLTCMEQGITVVSSARSEVSSTTHHPPRTKNHELRTKNHDNLPVLCINGREPSLKWPEGNKEQ